MADSGDLNDQNLDKNLEDEGDKQSENMLKENDNDEENKEMTVDESSQQAEEPQAENTEDLGDKKEAEEEKMEEGEPPKPEEKKEQMCIKLSTQHLERIFSMDVDATLGQLRSQIILHFNILPEQICLIYKAQLLLAEDETLLTDLDIKNGSQIHLVIKFNPPSEDPSNPPATQWYIPSNYSRLALSNIDFVSLQQQMQQQLQSNPEMVKEMMTSPLVTQLMSNHEQLKKMVFQLPQAVHMLEKNPDIYNMLNEEEGMKEMFSIATDPLLLQQLLSKMPNNQNQPGSPPNFSPQQLPSASTLLQMTSQQPELLDKMFKSEYFNNMIDGMVSNPQWTQQMICNNPLFNGNPQLKNQINILMPYFLQQIQNPDIKDLYRDKNKMKQLFKLQASLGVLLKECPDIFNGSLATPGVLSNELPSNVNNMETQRVNKGEIEPMIVMFNQIINQINNNKLDLPIESRYDEELKLMTSLGFSDEEINQQLLLATFGNVDAAVSQLLLQQQQQ